MFSDLGEDIETVGGVGSDFVSLDLGLTSLVGGVIFPTIVLCAPLCIPLIPREGFLVPDILILSLKGAEEKNEHSGLIGIKS